MTTPQNEFRKGTPREILGGRYLTVVGRSYDLAPDGRFLMLEESDEPEHQVRITLVQNFGEELKRRMPAD